MHHYIAKIVSVLHCVFKKTVTLCHCPYLRQILTFNFYARKQLLLSARLSHRNSVRLSVRPSVCPSVTGVDQAKTVQSRITKSSPSVALKTLVSGTIKLFINSKGVTPNKNAK